MVGWAKVKKRIEAESRLLELVEVLELLELLEVLVSLKRYEKKNITYEDK